jgi:hypothetical protein
MPDANVIASALLLSEQLPPEAIVLPEEKFHVTLIHQSILKPYKEKLKALKFPPAPPVIIESTCCPRINDDEGKKSWVIWLQNQAEMKAYVQDIMKLIGAPPGDPEPSRKFHISVANLTGKTSDSVR